MIDIRYGAPEYALKVTIRMNVKSDEVNDDVKSDEANVDVKSDEVKDDVKLSVRLIVVEIDVCEHKYSEYARRTENWGLTL